MTLIIALQVLALVFLAALFILFFGLPDSRTSPGKRICLVLAGSAVCVIAALAVSVTIKVQEKTGFSTGLSGGMESDARQWVSAHVTETPSQNQPGDNIKILKDGLAFLRTHPEVESSPEGSRIIGIYGVLPERPTRLLTRDEEIQYFEGAKAIFQLISNLGNSSQMNSVN